MILHFIQTTKILKEIQAGYGCGYQDALRWLKTTNKLLTNLNEYSSLDDNLANFYKKYVLVDLHESSSISKRTETQNSMQWSLDRSKRIWVLAKRTKYARNVAPNWERKIMSFIKPSKYQSVAMKNGKKRNLKDLYVDYTLLALSDICNQQFKLVTQNQCAKWSVTARC